MAIIPRPEPPKDQEQSNDMRLRILVWIGLAAFVVLVGLGIAGMVMSAIETVRPAPPDLLLVE